jgi:Filamin/ABP280 repeat
VVDTVVGKEVQFEINTAAAGKGAAKVNITGAKGQNVPCFLAERPGGFNAKFTPKETGPHAVQVTFTDKPVPNSPFKVNVIEVSS